MSDKAIKVKAELTAGGTRYGVTSAQCLTCINAWPTINVELLIKGSKEGKVVEVNGKLISELKKFKDPNTVYQLTFGCDDNIITVACICKSRKINISQNDTHIALVLAPEYTKVDALNLCLFKLTPRASEPQDIDGPAIIPKVTDSVIDYTKETYNVLKKRWEKNKEVYFGGTNHPTLIKTDQAIDKNNKKLYKYFEELLSNSQSSVGNLYEIKSNLENRPERLFHSITSVLCQETNSFLSIICAICNLFGLVYVPGLTNIGKLIPKSAMVVDGEKGSLSGGKVVAALVNTGSIGINPIGYAYTKTQGFDIDGGETARTRVMNQYTMYPEEPEDGCLSALPISPPKWAPLYNNAQAVDKSGADLSTKKSKRPRNKIKNEKAVKNIKYTQTEILTEWCRQHFYYQRYAPQTADILSFFCRADNSFGKIVDATDNEGNKLFTGFLGQYEMFLKKDIGARGGDIYTKFTLSCVFLPGETPV